MQKRVSEPKLLLTVQRRKKKEGNYFVSAKKRKAENLGASEAAETERRERLGTEQMNE